MQRTKRLTFLGVATLFLLMAAGFFRYRPPRWASDETVLNLILHILFFIVPAFVPVLTILHLSAVLRERRATTAAQSGVEKAWPFPSVMANLALAAALLLALAFNIFWATIWDGTNDGVDGAGLTMTTSFVALVVGSVLTVRKRGWRRLAGLAFVVLVPAFIFGAFHMGGDVSYHDITETRAARIEQALNQHYERDGYYPQTLGDLVPADLLFIPSPVILPGERWCYESDDRGYRLIAFYRETFSGPVTLRVYAFLGEPEPDARKCEQRLAEVKERYDPPFLR